MSREALRHPGAELSPEPISSHSVESSQPAYPVEIPDPSSTLPPFKLDRAPVSEGDDLNDSKGPWSSGSSSRPDSSGPRSTAGFGFPRPAQTTSSGSSFAGRELGPDPYGRHEADGGSRDRSRPLAADLSPDATLDDKSEEMSLSGLLGGRGRNDREDAPPGTDEDANDAPGESER